MLRAASTNIAKRAILNSSRGAPRTLAPRTTMAYHSSPPTNSDRENPPRDIALTEPSTSKGGLFGTGLSEWFALPIGITAAVPAIHFNWYVVNEETQLLAVFVAFCVACYTQGGDALFKALDAKSKAMLKEHNEAEDKVIQALETKADFLRTNQNMVEDFKAINEIREGGYVSLNEAGAIKPHHDFKAQMVRILNMVVQEEASVTERTKMALMEEATQSVTEQFATNKALKKAALTAAIAQIKGDDAGSAVDPVTNEFVQFFRAKGEEIKKSADGSEEKAQRDAMVAKINAVAKVEGFFFEFGADGVPKISASQTA